MPKRSSTPGVKLIKRKRKSGITWYGRWHHPFTLAWHDENLTDAGLDTVIARKRWAEAKSEDLRGLKRAKALGRATTGRTLVVDAAKSYLEDCNERLREGTRLVYREAVNGFTAWLTARHRLIVEEITAADLWAYRTATMRSRKRDGSKPKPITLSSHLTRVHALLEWWRRAKLLPLCAKDEIDDACEPLPIERAEIEPLTSAELGKLLEAAAAHPEEDARVLVALSLLTGMRLGELERLGRAQVRLDAKPGGEIRVGTETKTKRGRTIDLSVSPAAKKILAKLLERPATGPFVWGSKPLSRDVNKRWKAELQVEGLREWTWQNLRQSCGTYLTCAPGIFGAASAFRSAKQLGHSVTVAEQHYLGVLRGIPATVKTLEAAMGVVDVLKRITKSLGATTEPTDEA